jgi:orotidine-5'-phosphate decarboxylase
MNFAFFEVLGPDGWQALYEIRSSIPADIVVIADAKRGDISNTARAYAKAILDVLAFDAVTVNPYLGWEALAPFFEFQGTCTLVVCKTSNNGADSLQDTFVDGEPLYMRVARQVVRAHVPAQVGLVVGATHAHALQAVRGLSEDVLLLVPGVGAQGATVETARRFGSNKKGENAVISVSRDILFASSGPDYAEAARRRAQKFIAEMVEGHRTTPR